MKYFKKADKDRRVFALYLVPEGIEISEDDKFEELPNGVGVYTIPSNETDDFTEQSDYLKQMNGVYITLSEDIFCALNEKSLRSKKFIDVSGTLPANFFKEGKIYYIECEDSEFAKKKVLHCITSIDENEKDDKSEDFVSVDVLKNIYDYLSTGHIQIDDYSLDLENIDSKGTSLTNFTLKYGDTVLMTLKNVAPMNTVSFLLYLMNYVESDSVLKKVKMKKDEVIFG